MLTTDTHGLAIPTIIANKALGRFASFMNLAKTVTREFELTDAEEGETIKVLKRGAVTANLKGETDDVVVNNPTATGVDITLDSHFEVTFRMSDVLKAVKAKGVEVGLESYADDAAIALAEAVENKLAALYATLTATPIVWDGTSLATKKASLLKIRKYFVDNKVPVNLQRHLYADSEVATDILEEDSFNSFNATGQVGNIEEGQITRPLYGIKPFESQMVKKTGTTTIVSHNLAYTKGAFALACRPLPAVQAGLGAQVTVVQDPSVGIGLRVVRSYNSQKLAEQMTLDILIGAGVVDQRQAVEVSSSVTA